jgi:hypothetical protein
VATNVSEKLSVGGTTLLRNVGSHLTDYEVLRLNCYRSEIIRSEHILIIIMNNVRFLLGSTIPNTLHISDVKFSRQLRMLSLAYSLTPCNLVVTDISENIPSLRHHTSEDRSLYTLTYCIEFDQRVARQQIRKHKYRQQQKGNCVFYAVRSGWAHGAVGSLLPGNKAVNMHPQQWETGVFGGVQSKELY